jgi:nucleolar protein 15
MAVQEGSKKRKGKIYSTLNTLYYTKCIAAGPTAGTPPKKAKKASPVEKPASAKSRAASKPAPPAPTPAPEPVEEEAAEDEGELETDNEASEDDQTAALLRGFESSDDEDDEDNNIVVDKDEISTIPALPESADLQTKLTAASKSKSSEPGVVYLGRIPHGFYENQMKSYFVQFGEITKLRLSRNKKTGASKHYAFIEFAHEEVAKVVADTMNNYLMFGHILKAKLIPKDQVHENLFKGAGKRFKKVPWNRIDRFRQVAADREGWKNRVSNEQKKRSKKAAMMKELGYEYEAPELRSVDDVPVQQPKGIQAAQPEELVKAIVAPVVVPNSDEVKTLKGEEVETSKFEESKATSSAPARDSIAVPKARKASGARSVSSSRTVASTRSASGARTVSGEKGVKTRKTSGKVGGK